MGGSEADAAVPWSVRLWVCGSTSQLLFRSAHGHNMIVADPDILTQSFLKSGYGVARVAKKQSSLHAVCFDQRGKKKKN